jgi:hypothetical protein
LENPIGVIKFNFVVQLAAYPMLKAVIPLSAVFAMSGQPVSHSDHHHEPAALRVRGRPGGV